MCVYVCVLLAAGATEPQVKRLQTWKFSIFCFQVTQMTSVQSIINALLHAIGLLPLKILISQCEPRPNICAASCGEITLGKLLVVKGFGVVQFSERNMKRLLLALLPLLFVTAWGEYCELS